MSFNAAPAAEAQSVPSLQFARPPSDLYTRKTRFDPPTARPQVWRRFSVRLPTWSKWETFVGAAAPLVMGSAAIALLAGAMWQQSIPYMTMHQVGGTGRLDFYILGSCAVAPNTTESFCTPRSIHTNFVPSLMRISPGVPGFAVLQLPFYSVQSQVVFLTALIAMSLSFVVFIPVWTLAYFPEARILPAPMIEFVRYYPWYIYFASGVLSFTGTIFTITMGLGYRLLLAAHRDNFRIWIKSAFFRQLDGPGTTNWEVFLGGDGWGLIWTSAFFMALFTIGINVALHNGFDAAIERYETPAEKRGNDYSSY